VVALEAQEEQAVDPVAQEPDPQAPLLMIWPQVHLAAPSAALDKLILLPWGR